MGAGLQSWVNGVLHTDTSTVTSRALGMRVASAGHLEAITVPLQPGKTLWWHITINGNLNAYCYRNTFTGQGANQFTIQVDPPSWNQSQTGTAYIVWGEHSVATSGGGGGGAPDYTPDAISLTNVNIDTPNETGVGVPRKFQVTGINQPIQLKVARSNSTQTGNLTANRTLVRSSDNQNGPWTLHATFVGNGETEFMVSNGKWVEISFEKTTSSGRATSSYDVAVSNSTLNASMASFSVSAVVDNDNNFGVSDPHLDPIDWANISESSTSHQFATANAYRKLTGINQKVVLRATIENASGNFVGGSRLEMYVNGVLRFHSTNIANGSWAGGEFNPDEDVAFVAVIYGVNGEQRNASYTVRVTNQTTGALVDTFTVNQTAGVADYAQDAIDWPDFSLTTNDASINSSGVFRQITGINRPITVRVAVSGVTGNLSDYRTQLHYNPAGSASSGGPWSHANLKNGQSVDFTMTNGQWIYFDVWGSTTSGRRSGSWTTTITNVSTGQVIDTFKTTITVDNDDNFNVADYTPDPMSWSDMTLSTNEHYVQAAPPSKTITGINQPIRIRAEVLNVTGDISAGGIYIMKNGQAVGSYDIWTDGYGLREADYINGDVFNVIVDAQTVSGRKTGRCRVLITNVSTNSTLGEFWINFTVDANDDYNKNSGIPATDWMDLDHSYTSTSGMSSIPNYTTGNAKTISGLNPGQTATLTLSGSASGTAMAFVEIIKNGSGQGLKLYSPEGSTTVQNNYTGVTVQNGDSIAFRCGVGGRLAYSWEGQVSQDKTLNVTVNASLGGVIDTFTFNGSYTDWYDSGGGGIEN